MKCKVCKKDLTKEDYIVSLPGLDLFDLLDLGGKFISFIYLVLTKKIDNKAIYMHRSCINFQERQKFTYDMIPVSPKASFIISALLVSVLAFIGIYFIPDMKNIFIFMLIVIIILLSLFWWAVLKADNYIKKKLRF